MTNFRIPKRVDPDLAKGVDYHAEDGFGTFRLKYMDNYSRVQEVAEQRIKRTYPEAAKQADDAEGDNIPLITAILVEIALVGWSGIFDEDGEEVPFSKEAALEYLSHDELRRTAVECNLFARTASNFRQIDAGAITKN